MQRCAKLLHPHPTLCAPMARGLTGFSVHGHSPGKNAGVGCHAFSRRSSWPSDGTRISCISCIGRWVLYHYHHLESMKTISSVQLVMSDCLRPHGLQHARLLCPSPTHGAWSNSCPLNQWCHPTILSSVIPSSSCLQPFPASGSFPMSQFFTSGGQRQIYAGWEHTSWLSLGEDGLREPFNCWIDSQVLWCPRGL